MSISYPPLRPTRMRTLLSLTAGAVLWLVLSSCSGTDPSAETSPEVPASSAAPSAGTYESAEVGDANDLRILTGSWSTQERADYCAQDWQDAARSWDTPDAFESHGLRVGYQQAYIWTQEACFVDSDGDGVRDEEDQYPNDPNLTDQALHKIICSGVGRIVIDRAKPNWSKVWGKQFPRDTFCEGPNIKSAINGLEERIYKSSPGKYTLGIAYDQCVEHDTDWMRNQWPLGPGQAGEAQRALMLCPNHPQADAIRARIGAANLESQLRTQGRVFDDGLYRVGQKIQSGTYFATNVEDCYWERMNSAGAILDNYFGTALRVQVTIASSDFSFRSERCGTWRPVG